ncbi:hypothetical protein BKA56DRAFT_580745, partial [Ilyonectria sp. MPI-CAGE-AT-0026]
PYAWRQVLIGYVDLYLKSLECLYIAACPVYCAVDIGLSVFAVGFVSFAASFFSGYLSVLMHEKFAVCLLIWEAPVLVSYSLAAVDSSSFQVPVFEY